MGLWDILLLISVSAMGTLVAYLRSPRYKALILCIPIPFTFATLAVGENVNTTHVLGLLILLGFWFFVYWLRHGARLPIIPAIVLAATAYCIAGVFLVKIVPKTEMSFGIAVGLVSFAAVALHTKLPYRVEPKHSTQMPVWLKILLLSAIVLGLVAIKSFLAGFMTVFPMVGVLTAYESRYSLWTTCRQIPLLMISMVCMMTIIHLATPGIGIYFALALGWITMVTVMTVLLRHHWGREQEHIQASQLEVIFNDAHQLQ
jgi:hypothetical protein